MSERDYYPAGAYDDPNAPWNEHENPEREFDLEVCESVTRKATITTTGYGLYFDDEAGHDYVETDNIEWEDEYNEQYWSIPELLDQMRALIEKWKPESMSRGEKNLYQRIIDESNGWETDYFEVTDHE